MSTERSTAYVRAAAVFLSALLAAAPAEAHRVDVWAYVAGEQVIVEASYVDGAALQQANVRITDSAGATLATGVTDAEGRFSFTLAEISDHIDIVVDAGDGHQGRRTLSRAQLVGLATRMQAARPAPQDSAGAAPGISGSDVAIRAELAAIKMALVRNQATLLDVQEQLAELRRQQDRVSFESVLAGIGFIVGLTGVAAYGLSRRSKRT
ncbi:MAG: carboxypeptidase-like regulatory domain-containing protein [Planctomycetes bacterium]|nr:carboxypeptidase-like regulatory domain-containing protein [Planctomycetota bacterium]